VSWGAHWGLSTFTEVSTPSLVSLGVLWDPGVFTGVSGCSLDYWGVHLGPGVFTRGAALGPDLCPGGADWGQIPPQ